MLTCGLDRPDPKLADYVSSFLLDCPWIRRRVETIAFVDDTTISRHTTLDVSGFDVERGAATCPFHPTRPIVPIALLKKNLLVHFDLRDESSVALPVLPREIDTFFAWSLIMQIAARLVDPVDDHIAQHLWELVFKFPDPQDSPFSPEIKSWSVPVTWKKETSEQWQRLLLNQSFDRVLRDFTFNYLLLTQLPKGKAVHIVKYSYYQHLPFELDSWREHLGYVAPEIRIDAPAVGWGRSYHLEVDLPRELRAVDPLLYRVVQDRLGLLQRSVEAYDLVSHARTVEIHTTGDVPVADHLLVIPVRLSLGGYLRAIWMSTLFAAIVLLIGRIFLSDVVNALRVKSEAEAAVALLLVVPSLITAYLIRPEEHAIASSLLRTLRFAAASCGLLTYLAAGMLVLGLSGGRLADAWTIMCVVACAIAVSFTVAVNKTRKACKGADESCGFTKQLHIVESGLRY